MAQRTNAKLLAATVTPLPFWVDDGLVLLPVLLEVLSLEEDVEDEVAAEEDADFDDVARSVALLRVEFVVEFVVELVPDAVEFPKPPVLVVEFVPEPVTVELLEEPAAPVELVELDPEEMMGAATLLFELEEAVEEGEEVVAEPVAATEAEVDASATMAFVGQVEHPPNNCSMPE